MSYGSGDWAYGLGIGGESWDEWQDGEEPLPMQTPRDAMAGLTDQQIEAVVAPDAPLLVLAGAGTGKTRVLTTRIAQRLSQGGLMPSHVLALTFTKKAAEEMAKRLATMIGPSATAMDIGTFHSVFARALRACDSAGGVLGVRSDFTLLTDEDQRDLVKEAAASISASYAEEFAKKCKVRDVLADFSRYAASLYPGEPPFANPNKIPAFETLLEAYKRAKSRNNALDYDDVLIGFDRLLDDPRIRRMFQMRWRLVTVDEYQDTDNVQESILRKIAGRHRNITCVGDDDQSIYSWRNAKVSNILQFQSRWSDATIVRLESNYRSTAPILACANGLIGHNQMRHGKTLVSTRGPGEPVQTISYATAFDEARAVSASITAAVRGGTPLREIAVICRVAAGLQEIQRQLLTDGIRYSMHAGSNVANKIETKLVASWIRTAVNPRDEAAFQYAFFDSKRSIGKATFAKVKQDARVTEATVESILRQEYRDRSVTKHELLHQFLDDLTEVRTLARLGEAPAAIVEEIIDRSGIRDTIDKEREKAAKATNRDDRERLEATAEAREQNLTVLLDHASRVENLADLAANIILSNEQTSDDGESAWLGTIHAAKSLEFRRVHMVAFEDGIIPSPRYCADPSSAEYEEERNLAYVGMTRAKEILVMSWARSRTIYGTSQSGGPSEFVTELGLPP